METTNIEVKAVEKIVAEVVESQFRELNDVQLAFVGGGIADPLFL